MKLRITNLMILMLSACLFISCFTGFNGSNNGNTTSTNANQPASGNTNNTVKVYLSAGPSIVTYSFINDEGDVYKQGTLMANETITINHFLKGTYHLQYKVGSYTQTFKVLSITNDCTVSFGGSVTVTIN